MSHPGALARVSVIVPVGPGDSVSPVLHSQLCALPREAEVIVVHAGTVGGREVASIPGDAHGPHWKTLYAAAGRAVQQNAGADAACHEWLWFVHADSQLSPRTLPALCGFVRTGEPALGYFDLQFLDDGPALMWLNTLGAKLRSRWLGLPFGDQGLVMPRALFRSLGGFDTAVRCGEDHELVWRARRAGYRLRPLGAPIYTSARKYAQHGWARTTAWHLAETWRQAGRFARPGSGA